MHLPDWKWVDWRSLMGRFLLGLFWWPSMFLLVSDIVFGLIFLQFGMGANARSACPHPQYRKRWTQLYFGSSRQKRRRPGA